MTKADGGYTLLETLIAFAILASVLVALYAAGGGALRLIGAGSRLETASLLAESKLDEIETQRGPLPPMSAGAFSGSDVSWRIDAQNLPSEAAGQSPYVLQDVKITLTWPNGDQKKSMMISTRHLGTMAP